MTAYAMPGTRIHVIDLAHHDTARTVGLSLREKTLCSLAIDALPWGSVIVDRPEHVDGVCAACVANLGAAHLEALDAGRPAADRLGAIVGHIEDLTAIQLVAGVLPRLCGVTAVDAPACWFPEGSWRNDPPIRTCPDCAERYDVGRQLAAFKARYRELT